MRTIRHIAIIAAGLLCTTGLSAPALGQVAPAPAAAEAQVTQGYSVAVLPFSHSGKELEDMGRDIQALMTAYLTANPALMLVERAEVDKAMSEVELGMSGTVDPATAAKVGHPTGAQVLVTGRVFPIPSQRDFVLVAKIVGVETGRVYGATTTFPMDGKVTDAVLELSGKVGEDIAAKGETLIAHAPKTEDIVARLKPKLAGLALPSVSVSIDERVFGKEALDQSARTEMALLLQKLGFALVDPAQSNKRADIEIAGDATTEFALRKGNLVSARGRIEINATRRADGKVLLVDRENSVAVELSPEAAAKQSLEKAAGRLVERLVDAITATKE